MKTEAEGSLTIFSALSLLLILSFLLALLEGARVSGLKMMDTLAAETGMDCVAAEYQPVLWNKYHLLYLDGAYGSEQFEEHKVSSRVMEYVAGNASINITAPSIRIIGNNIFVPASSPSLRAILFRSSNASSASCSKRFVNPLLPFLKFCARRLPNLR